MGRIQFLLLCLVTLAIASSCYRDSYGYFSSAEREYYFVGGQPYDLDSMGAWPESADADIVALLTDREYYLGLHYHSASETWDRYIIRDGKAFSAMHLLPPEYGGSPFLYPPSNLYGTVSIVGTDVSLDVPVIESKSTLKDMALHGSFQREPAQALINEVRSASGTFNKSQGYVVANWTLTGIVNAQPFSITFKQNLTGACFSYTAMF